MKQIEIKNLVKIYQSGKTKVKALKGVNLEIGKGEFTTIAGPSGSGKTTLLNLIGLLDNPSEGQIFVKDQDVSKLKKNELSEYRKINIGFIFQTFNLIPVLSAFENIEFALTLLGKYNKQDIKNQTNKILEQVGLGSMGGRLPSELSGGQQQRVSIARALIKKPEIILADEPTANLDSKTGEDILKLMKNLNEENNITFIFSTHDKMVMDYAKRLLLLHDGEIQKDEIR